MRLLAAAVALGLSGCSYFFPSCQTIPPCPPGQILCTNASCADLSTDPLNCGACENVCAPGLSCLPTGVDGGGVCGCLPGYRLDGDACVLTSCANSSDALCPSDGGAVCAALATDAANCGACGKVCAGTERCFDGGCVATEDGGVPPDAGRPEDGGLGDGGAGP